MIKTLQWLVVRMEFEALPDFLGRLVLLTQEVKSLAQHLMGPPIRGIHLYGGLKIFFGLDVIFLPVEVEPRMVVICGGVIRHQDAGEQEKEKNQLETAHQGSHGSGPAYSP